jgi:hypothetical protein
LSARPNDFGEEIARGHVVEKLLERGSAALRARPVFRQFRAIVAADAHNLFFRLLRRGDRGEQAGDE